MGFLRVSIWGFPRTRFRVQGLTANQNTHVVLKLSESCSEDRISVVGVQWVASPLHGSC